MTKKAGPHNYRPESILLSPGQETIDLVTARLEAYGNMSAESEHLRPHQVEAIQKFVGTTAAILNGNAPNAGMSLLHPTGSGKSVSFAEMGRIFSAETPGLPPAVNTLALVPSHQILNQAVGDHENAGPFRTFAPDVSVGQYSGRSKDLSGRLTVMSYQSLGVAIKKGVIDALDPKLIICDESHHLIDGTWAEDVRQIGHGRLLVGGTATPAYSESRDMRNMFPQVLSIKTMREGIEEGILAELRGFVYKGLSKIVTTRGTKDYREEEVFNAIGESRDNYLAAAICAREVAAGRQGVVSCVPGHDRAHAKIVAKILNQTPVTMANGEKRFIRAAYVDGETHTESLEAIFKQYAKGDLDVLTYVNLLLEGWDSPQTQFSVMIRPTKSRVLAEQRIGRILRNKSAKVASVHDIVYEIEGDPKPQQTHVEVLQENRLSRYRSGRNKPNYVRPPRPQPNRTSAGRPLYDADSFTVDTALLNEMTGKDIDVSSDTTVVAGREALPYTWNSARVLATKFNVSFNEMQQIIASQAAGSLESQTIDIEGTQHTYYAPTAIPVIADHLGVKLLDITDPERPMTVSELVDHIRDSSYRARMRPSTIERRMQKAGIEPTLYITEDNQVVKTYPYKDRDVPITGGSRSTGNVENHERFTKEQVESTPILEAVSWLSQTLVNPKTASSAQQQQEIKAAQSCLLFTIRNKKMSSTSLEDQEALALELGNHNVQPTPQMINVMEAMDLSFVDLLLLADHARTRFGKLSTPRYRDAA